MAIYTITYFDSSTSKITASGLIVTHDPTRPNETSHYVHAGKDVEVIDIQPVKPETTGSLSIAPTSGTLATQRAIPRLEPDDSQVSKLSWSTSGAMARLVITPKVDPTDLGLTGPERPPQLLKIRLHPPISA